MKANPNHLDEEMLYLGGRLSVLDKELRAILVPLDFMVEPEMFALHDERVSLDKRVVAAVRADRYDLARPLLREQVAVSEMLLAGLKSFVEHGDCYRGAEFLDVLAEDEARMFAEFRQTAAEYKTILESPAPIGPESLALHNEAVELSREFLEVKGRLDAARAAKDSRTAHVALVDFALLLNVVTNRLKAARDADA